MFKLERQSNDIGNFLLCSMSEAEAKKSNITFAEGRENVRRLDAVGREALRAMRGFIWRGGTILLSSSIGSSFCSKRAQLNMKDYSSE